MSGLNIAIAYEIEQDAIRKKDKEALRNMKELEQKFMQERDVIIEKTPCGIRKKYVKRYGK